MTATEAPRPSRRRVRQRVRRRRSRGLTPLFVVGELLVTAGVVLGLFVVWNLVWTDYEAGQEQRAALERLEESWTVPDSSADDADADGDQPVSAEPGEGDPPAVSRADDGEPFARLHVPRWGADHALPIREGSAMSVINTGAAGRYSETQMPGEMGNFAIGAHRQSYGAAFRHIDALELGDRLIVRSAQAWFVYEVTETRIVQPHQVEVLAPVPGQVGAEANGRYITLTTCHPLWSTAERYIVHGELAEWYPFSADLPEHLLVSDE
ncbi:class E sortase [Bogoriella caseilytica]|uniref:Sortase A n=1 Tax=Bogoriella caseilytica TaxID=56055 RepID=A0A3N2BDM1_9MICO|nr:class E sortase [Bogoriella caseilytica]ROR73348.1 sortase A [Bogoriella caseilytica]